jgi:hypothetical protein
VTGIPHFFARFARLLLGASRSHPHFFIEVEALLVMAGVGAAVVFPKACAERFRQIERTYKKLARSRTLAVSLVGLLALAARVALLPVDPIPEPRIHDEFSYLLAADTFAHGRLTNPTHPMWVHFESFHILQKPTYMSKYYPAQGLILAAGQVIAGHPFWGVWFSVGMMCAAICWMLQGWVPASWALLGGILSVFRLAMFSYWDIGRVTILSYWNDSYWGGAVAATGGALVLGSLPRLGRKPTPRHALLLGLGLATLANSRPYEGLFLGGAVTCAAAGWMWTRHRPSLGVILRRVVVPLFFVLALTASMMGYYFWRVTGSPARIPYSLYAQTYDHVPVFAWQPMESPPDYRHRIMEKFYSGFPVINYYYMRKHPVKSEFDRAIRFGGFLWGPLLTMPIVVLLLATHSRFFGVVCKASKARSLIFLCLPPAIGLALPIYYLPHYAAPLTAALYALVVIVLRHLRLWPWRGQPVGRQIVRMVPALLVVISVVQTTLALEQRGAFPRARDFGRSAMLAQLRAYSAGQLVVVHYAPNHDPTNEWVYNDADIDAAKVVWARDMGTSGNEELIRYFKDRQVWLLEADDTPPKLLPYSPGEGISQSSLAR